ncbi:hypothetical protein [Polymorphospora lycopeni]|uniref:Uncharacterized protein n=1 Tax=Polymorphospora lycopeni TaxID=3140240 RepID=A0ABV5CKW7_9ACTN
MPDPRTRTPAATAAAKKLHFLMYQDLDEVRGGFRWWHQYLSHARVIFTSDYLLQIASRLKTGLAAAAHREAEFIEAWRAETIWMRQNAHKGAAAFASRGSVDWRREQRIGTSLEGFFYSVGGILDAVGGAGIGVLGLRTDLVRSSWSQLMTAASGDDRDRRRLLAPDGTEAHEVQVKALAAIAAAAAGGPHGWLTWTTDMRNTLVHRARRFEMQNLYRPSRRADLEFTLHLPRDPQFTDVEAFAISDKFEDVMLPEHAGDTIAGVLNELGRLVEAAASHLQDVWVRRRTRPELIQQPEEQWRTVYPTKRDLSRFGGFGTKTPPPTGQQVLHPGTARRLRAAKGYDGDRAAWQKLLADG